MHKSIRFMRKLNGFMHKLLLSRYKRNGKPYWMGLPFLLLAPSVCVKHFVRLRQLLCLFTSDGSGVCQFSRPCQCQVNVVADVLLTEQLVEVVALQHCIYLRVDT